MPDEGASRIFGWVSIVVSGCSLWLAIRNADNPVLYVTLITWGALFLVLGVVLLAVRRLF